METFNNNIEKTERMFYLKQSLKDGLWYFSLKSGNNEVIAPSEGYSTKQMAIKGMISVLINCAKLAALRLIGAPWYKVTIDTREEPAAISAEQEKVVKKPRRPRNVNK